MCFMRRYGIRCILFFCFSDPPPPPYSPPKLPPYSPGPSHPPADDGSLAPSKPPLPNPQPQPHHGSPPLYSQHPPGPTPNVSPQPPAGPQPQQPHQGGGTHHGHTLVWKGQGNLDDQLNSNLEQGDFFYLFTGDTQYHYYCSDNNDGCLKATKCKDGDGQLCRKAQSEWANKYQEISLRTVIDRVQTATGHIPRAMVMNGDLTQSGYDYELKLYQDNWQDFDKRFVTYPGLGNHDYYNNVDNYPKKNCPDNICANLVLTYFRDHVTQRLHKHMDVNQNGKTITGSLSYSWDECDQQGSCFHFTQQNHYPNYKRNIRSATATWEITSSLKWLENDLKQKPAVPTIINFHDFDDGMDQNAKTALHQIIDQSPANVLAIFFAHKHSLIGVKGSPWCTSKHRPIFHIYSGSVCGNNYALVHLSPTRRKMKAMYKVHVDDEGSSSIEEEPLKHNCGGS